MSFEKCVRCGSCLKICPIFDAVGEEQYSPRGKTYVLQVMDLIEEDEELGKEFRRLLFQCTMCGRCKEICSSDVDLLEVWHDSRGRALKEAPKEFGYLDSLRDALANVQNIYGLDPEDRAIYWLDELRDIIPGIEDHVYEEGKTADVVVFLGCLMSFRYSQMDVLRSFFKSLERAEIDYLVMGSQEFCCGHPLHLMGDEEGADVLRKHNKKVIESTGADYVVTCCPGCLIQLSMHHSLEGVEALHHTQFFDRQYDSLPKYESEEDFAYHDPCELHRICDVKTEPRSLLAKMNVSYKEMELSCCGGGGLLRMTDPDLSDKIIRLRAASEHLRKYTVITACPSCREQLLGNNLETVDIVELMDAALEEGR
ncbi:(Fe-S)-binding protein [Candidatus Thorarchaeota archaeon]|nr:MAG: (Fe-S)-binding protein [Candidatus Thorarchaeota archaeon]